MLRYDMYAIKTETNICEFENEIEIETETVCSPDLICSVLSLNVSYCFIQQIQCDIVC